MYLTHTLFRSKYKEITIRITFLLHVKFEKYMYIWPISLIKYKVFPLFPYIITSICKFMISLSTDFQICGVHVIDKALSDFLIDVERCSVCTLSLIRQRGSSRSFWEVLERQSCQQWSGYCVFWPFVPSPVFWKFYLISFLLYTVAHIEIWFYNRMCFPKYWFHYIRTCI